MGCSALFHCCSRVVRRSVTKVLDDASPYVDARLPDGTRVHAILSTIATPGTCLPLRKSARRKFSLESLRVRPDRVVGGRKPGGDVGHS